MSYFSDETITLHHGDALEVARTLETGSVDCIVTSPPYYGLRDYGSEGQYGLEETPAQYVETMRALFSELRRVLADDGTFWLNLGDSYNAYNGNRGKSKTGFSRNDPMPELPKGAGLTVKDLPAKNLLGIPWRVAFALQDDGWILRNSIIWNKPNAMPESVTDRLSTRHENIFMFSKSQRYWFDLAPIREKLLRPEALNEGIVFGGKKASELQTGSSARRTGGTYKKKRSADEPANAGTGLAAHSGYRGEHEDGKNPGDVWNITTKPFSGAHFAVFPPELPRRCILAGSKPGGVVLDPFHGSGTTGKVATENGRRYVGIDISADYLDLSLRTRLSTGTLDLGAL